MFTAPKLEIDRPLQDLKTEGFSGVLAKGNLSTGLEYQISFSAKSAVEDGFHFIVTFPGATELTDIEAMEAFGVANAFAREIPEARAHGYRFAQNFGDTMTRPEPHAHIIVAGSDAESAAAPRLISPWRKV